MLVKRKFIRVFMLFEVGKSLPEHRFHTSSIFITHLQQGSQRGQAADQAFWKMCCSFEQYSKNDYSAI